MHSNSKPAHKGAYVHPIISKKLLRSISVACLFNLHNSSNNASIKETILHYTRCHKLSIPITCKFSMILWNILQSNIVSMPEHHALKVYIGADAKLCNI